MPPGAEKFIRSLAREGGDVAWKYFGKAHAEYTKSKHPTDVVTKADFACERILRSRIKKQYPRHGIIGEEYAETNPDAEYTWIIDPIDGTLNFSTSVPMFCTMVALARKGEVILSAIYIPLTKELFFAKKGGGAYCNGKRIRTSAMTNWKQSLGCGPATLRSKALTFLKKFFAGAEKGQFTLHIYGTIASACYVASGRRDWFVSFSGKVWDYAPAYLLMKEAGCAATDAKGRSWKLGVNELIAANPRLHKELLKLTKNI